METTPHTILTRSPEETHAVAVRIGHAAKPGDCIMLTGNLGAGKTHMAKGIAEGLEIDPRHVTSPTFVLMTRHEGRLTLYHFDAYRLSDSSEMLEIGAEEAFYGDGVTVVEWADRVEDILPHDRLDVNITLTGRETRTFHLSATGSASQALLETVRRETSQP